MATRALAHFYPPWVTRIRPVIARQRRWIWIILTLAGLLFAARAVSGSRGELLVGLSNLRRASWIWLVSAIAAECGAFIALGRAQRRVLHGGGVNVSAGVLARLAVAAQAVGSVLPGGYLFSGVVVLRVLARRGISQLLVLWMLAMVPPWRGLLIAYAAGQFAALLPITPGGLGATVGGMSAALAAYGGTSAGHGGTGGALAAVLLYRLINYWAVLPAGGICYLSLRRGPR